MDGLHLDESVADDKRVGPAFDAGALRLDQPLEEAVLSVRVAGEVRIVGIR
jgi:hypothetical protein